MYFSTYSSQILFLFYQYATFLSHNLRVWIQSIAPQKDCRQPQDQQQPKQTRSFLQPVYLILWSIEKPLLSLQQIQHLQTVFISSEYIPIIHNTNALNTVPIRYFFFIKFISIHHLSLLFFPIIPRLSVPQIRLSKMQEHILLRSSLS